MGIGNEKSMLVRAELRFDVICAGTCLTGSQFRLPVLQRRNKLMIHISSVRAKLRTMQVVIGK